MLSISFWFASIGCVPEKVALRHKRYLFSHLVCVLGFCCCDFFADFFFFTFINLFFIASGHHTMFQKQLPIFTVSFPKSSKYLPVLFVIYTPSYKEGQKGCFPLLHRRETQAREEPAPQESHWDRSQEGWVKARDGSCTSRRISLGVIDLLL